MADYERLVRDLNSKISEKDEGAEDLNSQINTLSQKVDTLKQEIGMYTLPLTYYTLIETPTTYFMLSSVIM